MQCLLIEPGEELYLLRKCAGCAGRGSVRVLVPTMDEALERSDCWRCGGSGRELVRVHAEEVRAPPTGGARAGFSLRPRERSAAGRQ